jgi:hypothetical protein
MCSGVIFDLLVSTKHNAFPVIVEDPTFGSRFFARWVGNYFNEGIYDIHIHLRHAPFLDWNPSLRGSFLRVKHIMTPNPKTLRTVERAGTIMWMEVLVSASDVSDLAVQCAQESSSICWSAPSTTRSR